MKLSEDTRKPMTQLLATLKLVNWHTALFVAITPVAAIYGLCTTPFVAKTWLVAFIGFYLGMICVTTAYHRMYSHRTFKVVRPVEIILLFWCTSAFSMSAVHWVKDHRAHHAYTDTDKDPYNIKKGFWWAHLGWLIWKRKMPKTDVSDIKSDPLLYWQHKNFYWMAVVTGFGLPTLLCGLGWGDWRGGFYIAAVFKAVILHHTMFSINSWAHYFGDTPYNDSITPRDSWYMIWAMGEGYHNFHHEFPNDYRNGAHFTAIDPTKWLIATLEFFGLATGVKRHSADQIKLSKLQMIQRKVEEEKRTIFMGSPLETLPYYNMEQIEEMVDKRDAMLVIMDGVVFNVKQFAEVHPGGRQFLKNNNGKDITKAFNGGVYNHSNAANNLLQTLRCGRLSKGNISHA